MFYIKENMRKEVEKKVMQIIIIGMKDSFGVRD